LNNPENDNNLNDNNNKPVRFLRCINIDCVFNSSNNPDQQRNTCNHPNLKVESKFADITIAICSEFRSKKDYSLIKSNTIVDLKTKAEIEIIGQPDPAFTHIEKITTGELEDSINKTAEQDKELAGVSKSETGTPQVIEYEKPVVIKTVDEKTIVTEPYLTTDTNFSDLQLLKRLYQPYLRRGIVVSIIAHLFVIWLLYTFAVTKDDKTDPSQQQRIVVVEDIETPKFEPPLVDMPNDKEKTEDVGENLNEVRPKITPKNIRPRINRPKDLTADTSKTVSNIPTDSLRRVTDSLLALKLGDTTRLNLPDSLKNFMPANAINLGIWWPKDWKMTDNRAVNLNQEQFNGVIINTDSASADPGAVTIFIQIDDPKHSAFNKTTFKNTFAMTDTTATAFSTDPTLTGSKRISYKFFVFADPAGLKNIFVNTETKKDLFDKYKPYIEAIVRSVNIKNKPMESGK
jgi:hypothetical protein